MFLLIVKRLSILIPGLLLLSVLLFGLSRWIDEDPALTAMTTGAIRSADSDPAAYDRAYQNLAVRLGLDQPTFYFGVSSAASPDTLHRIVRRDQREVQLSLLQQFGNWPAIQDYYRSLRSLAYQNNEAVALAARELLLYDDPERIDNFIEAADLPEALIDSWEKVTQNPQRSSLFLPALRWNGIDNQYHHWLMRTMTGDFGVAYLDGRPVAEKIWPALRWTALLNGIAIFLAYLISIPVGLYTAWHAGGRADRFFDTFFLILFSLPAFWAASMMSSFLTTPAFGIDLFPTIGVGDPGPDASWWQYLKIRAHHLFLPILCLTYPSLAFLTRQMRAAALVELGRDYVKTARMKGLSVNRVLWGHVLRNASFPLITLLASLLPALLAGSVLIEIIFNLPGMGRVLIDSIVASDWPVVITITLLNGLLTVVGLLLADIGYSLADPRVRLGAKQTAT